MKPLQTLKTRHRELGRLKFQGLSTKEIAERVELAPGTVSSLLNQPLMQGYINGLQDRADDQVIDVRKKLAELIIPAIDIQAGMLDPTKNALINPSVQLAASKDVLDRTGYKPPEKSFHHHSVITAADLLELKNRASLVDTTYLDAITVN
jgi:hypothetical protein